MTANASSRLQRSTITITYIGGAIEWYDMLLYSYLAPIIAPFLFPSYIEEEWLFAFGLSGRLLGGYVFGRLGDRIGIEKSFLCTIISASIASFLIMFLRPCSEWGYYSFAVIICIRMLHGISAGGEIPVAMCWLFETASSKNQKYITSFSFFGPLLGALVAVLVCITLNTFLSHQDLVDWGWKVPFEVGAVAGIIFSFLRYFLGVRTNLEKKREKKSLFKLLKEQWQNLGKCNLYYFSEVISYFMLSVFLFYYLNVLNPLNYITNLTIVGYFLCLSLVLLPIFGKLGDKFRNKPLFIGSCLGILCICYPIYFCIAHFYIISTFILLSIFTALVTVQMALLPSLALKLFPKEIRYTCLGLGFNSCDSLVGGLIPALALIYTQKIDVSVAAWIVAGAAVVSLVTFFICMKKEE